MRILALQLKRIGDLVLTTPALSALRSAWPAAEITLAVENGSRELLPAIPGIDDTLVYARHGTNFALWSNVLRRRWDICVDFTGNDRSAAFSALSKAPRRVAFCSVKKKGLRRLCYQTFVSSPVRDHHTIDHYLHLVAFAGDVRPAIAPSISLQLPAGSVTKADHLLAQAGVRSPYVMIHPGTARSEKFWMSERWAAVIDHCEGEMGVRCVITGSSDAFEQEHIGKILAARKGPTVDFSGKLDLCSVAAVAQRAALVVSVDSAPMHLAAAWERPQVALFGPTNPFHWRPRHQRAVVLTPAAPAPLVDERRYQARPLSEMSTRQVIDGIHSLPDLF